MMQLYQGDCLEVLRGLPDASVDAVIADPPYGTTACKWDSVIPFAPMWEQLRRVTKPNAAIVLFAAQPFTSALVMSNPREFRYEWVWRKSIRSGYANCRNAPMTGHETIQVFSRGTYGNGSRRRMSYNPQGLHPIALLRTRDGTENRQHRPGRTPKTYAYTQTATGYPDTVLTFASETGHHPTQKPLDLLTYLVRTYTNPGETVLDFCFGSGTTGVACVQEGRRFIGVERDARYFAIAERRIATAQPPLPIAEGATA